MSPETKIVKPLARGSKDRANDGKWGRQKELVSHFQAEMAFGSLGIRSMAGRWLATATRARVVRTATWTPSCCKRS